MVNTAVRKSPSGTLIENQSSLKRCTVRPDASGMGVAVAALSFGSKGSSAAQSDVQERSLMQS